MIENPLKDYKKRSGSSWKDLIHDSDLGLSQLQKISTSSPEDLVAVRAGTLLKLERRLGIDMYGYLRKAILSDRFNILPPRKKKK